MDNTAKQPSNSEEDDQRSNLSSLASQYLEDLFNLLVKDGIITPIESDRKDLSNQIATESTSETRPATIESKNLIQQLYDLQSVLRAVYEHSAKDKLPISNFASYIEYFNQKNIVNIPLHDPTIATLFSNLNNIGTDELGEKWHNAFSKSGIDTGVESLKALEYFTKVEVESIGLRRDLVLSPSFYPYPVLGDVLASKRDYSMLIIHQVKFRREILDLKNIVLRAIDDYKNYPVNFEAIGKHLILIVYTMQEEHTFSRLHGQFQKILVEVSESLLMQLHFIPVSIFKIDNLADGLIKCYNNIQFEVKFDYSDSPLSHGWRIDSRTNVVGFTYQYEEDLIYDRVLHVKFPTSYGLDYLDFTLTVQEKWRFQQVRFILRPSSDFKIYVEVSDQKNKDRLWFELVNGERDPIENSTNGTEYQVFVPFEGIDGDWETVSINAIEIFNNTFAKKGRRFNRIEGIRLRGELVVARIFFESAS